MWLRVVGDGPDSGRSRVDAELGVRVLEVATHRPTRDPEVLGDLCVGLALGDEEQDLAFPSRQRRTEPAFVETVTSRASSLVAHREVRPQDVEQQAIGRIEVAVSAPRQEEHLRMRERCVEADGDQALDSEGSKPLGVDPAGTERAHLDEVGEPVCTPVPRGLVVVADRVVVPSLPVIQVSLSRVRHVWGRRDDEFPLCDPVELAERHGVARYEPLEGGEERGREGLVAFDRSYLGDEPADALEITGVEALHLVTKDTTNVTWTQPGAVGDRGATSSQGEIMNRISKRAVIVCAAFATVLSAPAVARADVIGEWNAFAQAQTIPIRPTAHGESRGMAMVEGAVYDAVNALQPDHRPYLLDLQALHAQPFGSQAAAIATAAHDVLVTIVPSGQVGAVHAQRDATLAGIADGPSKTEGIRVGAAAAAAMLAFRLNDGYLAAFPFDIGSDPGDWRPVGWPFALPDPRADPDAWVANEKPFLIESPSQFRSNGPNALTSRAYEKDFHEVKSLGAIDSTTRTADQTAAAVFWQFPPIALWNQLARDQLSPRFGLDTADQARLYAIVNLAAADAAISCWNDKYYWSFWRPRAAIREAGTDGNPATVPDPNWESLFAPATQTTPPLGP